MSKKGRKSLGITIEDKVDHLERAVNRLEIAVDRLFDKFQRLENGEKEEWDDTVDFEEDRHPHDIDQF